MIKKDMRARIENSRFRLMAAYALGEVLLAFAIISLVFAGLIYGYVQANRMSEFSSMSLAAQSFAAQGAEQARASDNQIVQTGVADLAQAIAQSRRFFANSRFQETATVDHIAIGAEGRQARLSVRQVTRIESPGKPVRTLCAETEQTLVLVDGAIRSRGQTETAMRCP